MAHAEIRDNLRTHLIESRQLNRDKILRSKRKALQDVVNVGRDVTEGEVAMIGNKLKSKSAVQVEDLALLKLAFVQSENNIVAFLKVNGALHGLTRELSSNKSSYQLVAAECCCNLALGNARSCLLVAKAAGPYFIAMLSGCNYNLISVSVWALGNLVGSDNDTWKILHTQGFLGKLLQLIEDHDTSANIPAKDEVQQNSLIALVQLLYKGLKLLSVEDMESITKTVSNLSNTSGKGLRICEYLLSCSEVAERELIGKKVHLKCLQFLEQTELTDENIASFTPSLRTIANLVADLSGACALEVFANWKSLQDTTQKIFSSPYPHLVSELGWLYGNFMNHPSPDVRPLLQEHSFDFQLFQSQYAFFNVTYSK